MASSNFISVSDRGLTYLGRQEGESPDPSASDCSEVVLLGEGAAVRRLRSQIRRIAPYFRTALLRGEAGSGKEGVARALHALSPGCDGPFVATNASDFSDSIATLSRNPRAATSLFESAQGGTLYIDDVAECSPEAQAALLRLLQAFGDSRGSPAARRFGEPANLARSSSGTKVLAASDRDLRMLASIGQFRQDLYALLSSAEIVAPPLRQRLEDIPALARWMLCRIAEENGRRPNQLAESTIPELQARRWPGNLHELWQVLTDASALADGLPIEPRHLLSLVDPAFAGTTAAPEPRLDRLQDVVQNHVLEVLTRCDGNKLRAAEALGISRSTLYRMLDAESARKRSSRH